MTDSLELLESHISSCQKQISKLFICFITDKQLNINNCEDDKLINRVINWSFDSYYVKNNLKYRKKISDKQIKFSHK